MRNKSIPEIINQIAKSLKQQSNSIFTHSGNIGDSKEKALIAFLKKVMPKCYGFSSGEIIDIANNRSLQTDVIIYDKLYSPYFADGSGKIVAPVDSIYGTIEVKSILNSAALTQVKKQIASLNSLKRNEPKGLQLNPYMCMQYDDILKVPKSKNDLLYAIFAYKTDLSIDTIVNKIITNNIKVHLILVYNKFLIFTNNYQNILKVGVKSLNDTYGFEDSNSIAVFILLLQMYLSNSKLVGTNMFPLIIDLFQSGNIITWDLNKDIPIKKTKS
jgi:hypothetical protein